jgi:hypothetical protein
MWLSRWPGGSRITAERVFDPSDEATRHAGLPLTQDAPTALMPGYFNQNSSSVKPCSINRAATGLKFDFRDRRRPVGCSDLRQQNKTSVSWQFEGVSNVGF